jgi:hypothetical protein
MRLCLLFARRKINPQAGDFLLDESLNRMADELGNQITA